MLIFELTITFRVQQHYEMVNFLLDILNAERVNGSFEFNGAAHILKFR